MKTCCVTGHRDIPKATLPQLRTALLQAVETAAGDGYTLFVSGFARGADLYFAEAVLECKTRLPGISLAAALPYAARAKSKDPLFARLLAECDHVIPVSEGYAVGCYRRRNEYLLRVSQRVIAVYDGRPRGGTAATLRRAEALGREIVPIWIGV